MKNQKESVKMIICKNCGNVNPLGTYDEWCHACGAEIDIEEEDDILEDLGHMHECEKDYGYDGEY